MIWDSYVFGGVCLSFWMSVILFRTFFNDKMTNCNYGGRLHSRSVFSNRFYHNSQNYFKNSEKNTNLWKIHCYKKYFVYTIILINLFYFNYINYCKRYNWISNWIFCKDINRITNLNGRYIVKISWAERRMISSDIKWNIRLMFVLKKEKNPTL